MNRSFVVAGRRISAYMDKRLCVDQEFCMPNPANTRWTISVSRETDIVVRSFLAQRGLKKGDLSKFIEDAVRWRVLDQTLAEVRGRFSDMPPASLEALIDEAVTAARATNAQASG